MELKTLEATTQATTDLGQFEAIAAAWTEDREKDVIHRGAFSRTIRSWRRSGKRLPLHWDHKGDPDKIIGHIDPLSMQERDDGLFVSGQIDLEGSKLGREAWRLIKNGVVGLSFGYLPTQAKARQGGGRDLHELDMFEVSITPAPMHPDTRILSTKGITVDDLVETTREHPQVVEAVVETVREGGGRSVEAREQRKRAEALEFEEIAGKAAKPSDTPHPEPFSTSTTSNWVARAGGLPPFIQNIAHDLLEKGRAQSESEAIQMAIGICHNPPKNWGAVARAKAAAAIAEWEKMRAEAHAKPGKSLEITPGELAQMIEEGQTKAVAAALAEWEQKKAEEVEAAEKEATLRKRADAVEFEEVAGDDLKAKKPDTKPQQQTTAGNAGAGGGGEVRMLQSMIAQGREYLAGEPDGNDKAVMEEILSLLTELTSAEESDEQAEGEKKLPSRRRGVKPAKSRRDRDGTDDADVTGDYRRVDPLRRQADAIALEYFSDGESRRKSPIVKSAPKPEPELSLKELEQRMRDEMLIALVHDESLVH